MTTGEDKAAYFALKHQHDIPNHLKTAVGRLVVGSEQHVVRTGISWIGSANHCHIRLPDSGVSSLHAMLEATDKMVFVEDIASTNGTQVGSTLLQDKHLYQLRSGDSVVFGPTKCVYYSNEHDPLTGVQLLVDSQEPVTPAALSKHDPLEHAKKPLKPTAEPTDRLDSIPLAVASKRKPKKQPADAAAAKKKAKEQELLDNDDSDDLFEAVIAKQAAKEVELIVEHPIMTDAPKDDLSKTKPKDDLSKVKTKENVSPKVDLLKAESKKTKPKVVAKATAVKSTAKKPNREEQSRSLANSPINSPRGSQRLEVSSETVKVLFTGLDDDQEQREVYNFHPDC